MIFIIMSKNNAPRIRQASSYNAIGKTHTTAPAPIHVYAKSTCSARPIKFFDGFQKRKRVRWARPLSPVSS